MKRFAITTLLVLPFCALAEDFTLADGTVLKEAEVLHRGDHDIQIRHAGGIERFSYKELGVEMQQRFELTPEHVAARRKQATEAAAEKRRAREQAAAEKQRRMQEDQEARTAALELSGKYARYLTGADVMGLVAGMVTLEARAAEFLAAEWNYREAVRLQLPQDALRFEAEMNTRRAGYEKECKKQENLRVELETLRAKAQDQAARIKLLNDEVAALRAKVAQLNKELGRAEAEAVDAKTTVVIDRPVPVYVPSPPPTCIGHTTIRPKPCAPRPKPVRPAPRPHHHHHSPGPRPASSAKKI